MISPNEDYLAVLTTHTIHICVIPDSERLTAEDKSPLKPKFFTLGPTTHVTSRSALMSALWHPLGVQGSSVVTVTEDAVVRVWEVSPSDRWSFDAPTLAVDLKKLADGTTLDQDFSASTNATNRGYSVDMYDMEVAAASFAVRGSGLWASMTLYIATRGGDVYALCPLLPQLWAPPPTLIPSLSVSIVAKVAAIEDDPNVSPQDKLLAQQQLEWMSDLDNQEPRTVQDSLGDQPIEVYQRPTHPGMFPRLQGPFDLEMALDEDQQDDLDMELSDIYVIGRKMETEELMEEEDETLMLDENEQQGLSLTIICLLSTSGQVRVCLDMEGVEARWLPPRIKSRTAPVYDNPDLPPMLTFETLDVISATEVTPDCWPTFSDDVVSRYSFFVTHSSGITQVSLASWVFRLESELNTEAPAGSDMRVNLIAQARSEVERVYVEPAAGNILTAAVAIRDPDLGYFLLSATPTDPLALIFDTPDEDFAPFKASVSPTPFIEPTPERQAPTEIFWTPRPALQPPAIFEQPSELPKLQQALTSSKYGAIMGQQVRLSPATLKIFSNVHQVLSLETGRLNEAVAELFRRCDAFRSELKDQVQKANELKTRIEQITGDEENESDEVRLTRALAERKQKQDELMQRFENLKRKVQQKAARELSAKEKAWADEVKGYDQGLSEAEENNKEMKTTMSKSLQPLKRLEEIRNLKDELSQQVAEVEGKEKNNTIERAPQKSVSPSVSSLKIPTEIRKAKVAQVMNLLNRETQLVDALQEKLERLSVG